MSEGKGYFKLICNGCGDVILETDSFLTMSTWRDTFIDKHFKCKPSCWGEGVELDASEDAPREKRKCSCGKTFVVFKGEIGRWECSACAVKRFSETLDKETYRYISDSEMERGFRQAEEQYKKNVKDVARSHGIDPDSIL